MHFWNLCDKGYKGLWVETKNSHTSGTGSTPFHVTAEIDKLPALCPVNGTDPCPVNGTGPYPVNGTAMQDTRPVHGAELRPDRSRTLRGRSSNAVD